MKMKILAVLALASLVAGCAPTTQTLGSFLTRARAQEVPVLIYAYGVPGAISAGSNRIVVPVYVQFVVTGKQPIRTIRFTLIGYNTRGLAVHSRQGLGIAITLIGPGPFHLNKNYEVNSFHTRTGFPGDEVACIRLAAMQVLYADGRSRNYDAESLTPLLSPPLRKGCDDTGPPVNFMGGGG